MPALCSPPLYRLVVLDIFYNSSPLLEALVVCTEEASKDCGRQHVPKDLHVVCFHLFVSSLSSVGSGFSFNPSALLEALVVCTEEASKDSGRQHVPDDLHVVCLHLLVSSLLLGGLPGGPLLLFVLLRTIVEGVC